MLKFRLAFILAFCFCMSFVALAAEPPATFSRIIKSGCEIDYPPFCIVPPNGQATGFSVELFNAVCQEMGHSVSYITGPWSQIKAALEKAEVDALPLVGRTPVREQLFDFTVPYMTLHGVIVVRKDCEDIFTVHDLKGREVAVMKNDNAEEFVDRNDLGVIKKTYPTFFDALKQVNDGKHDAVISQKLVAMKLIKDGGLTNLKILPHPVAGFHQDFCFAVPEGRKETLALLNEGLARVIANGTYQMLHAKWFAALELEESPRIIVGADLNYPPFEFIDENGQPAGFNYDLLKAVASATSLEIVFRPALWSETVTKLENGKIDMIQGMFFSPERATRFSFSAPTIVSHCVAVVRNNTFKPPESLAELRNLRLVVEENDIMHDYVRKYNLASQTVAVKSQELALLELIAGKRDCALVSRMGAAYLIEKNNWNSLNIAKEPLLSPRYCFATRHNQRGLLAKLNEGLKIVERSGEYHQIVERWFGVEDNSERTLQRILRYFFIVTGPLLLVLIIFFFWSWSLKQQVRRKTEDLRNSEEQFRSLIEGAPFGIFVQTGGLFSYFNQGIIDIFALKDEKEILHKPVLDFFHLKFHDEARQRIFALNFAKQAQEPIRNLAVRKDGTTVPVEISAVPTHFAGEDGALVFVRDISHQLQLEEQLMQSSKMEAVGHLAGGVAHDYNNMLSVILGYTELALAKISPLDPIHQNLKEIYAAAIRSAEITSQLLAFARKQVIAPKIMNINLGIESMLKMLKRLIGEDVELVWRPGYDLFSVKLDPIQLDQILANLCVNARDAISGRGQIRIVTENRSVSKDDATEELAAGHYVYLSVSDNGCGMTDKIREKIFEPFFTTKELGRGTGLGLATVYGIVKQNKGQVTVLSAPQEGTKFEILFPAAEPETKMIEKPEKAILPKGKNQVILLVEDEEAILKLSKKVIEGLQYQVLAANLPSLALKIAADMNQPIDLLVTDVIMPEMNGKELYAEIKKIRPELQVLYVSGYSSEIMGQGGILDDQVHFIEKPFAIGDMARKINEILLKK